MTSNSTLSGDTERSTTSNGLPSARNGHVIRSPSIDLRTSAPGSRLLERDQAISELRAMIDRARRSKPGIAVIEGEHGLGRSALLNTACELVMQAGGHVLRATACDQEQRLPFGVVRQIAALLHASRSLDADRYARIRRLGAAEPDPAEILEIYQDLDDALALYASDDFVVIAIDDAPFTDSASLEWLHFVSRRLANRPIALLLTAVPSHDAMRRAPLDPIVADSGTRRIEVLPLSEDAVTRLVTAKVGHHLEEAAPGVGEACFAATRGNPSLLFSLIDDLNARSTDWTTDAVLARIADASPHRVVRSIVHRASLAGAEAVRILEVVSLVDGLLTSRDVAQIAWLEPDPVEHTIVQLSELGILEAAEPLRFVYPIVRTALEHAMSDGDRTALHLRCARHLRDRAFPPETIAAHLLDSPPTNDLGFLELLVQAASSALAANHLDQGRDLLARAHREAALPSDRVDLRLQFAEVEMRLAPSRALERLTDLTDLSGQADKLTAVACAAAEAAGAPHLDAVRDLIIQHQDELAESDAPDPFDVDLMVALLDRTQHPNRYRSLGRSSSVRADRKKSSDRIVAYALAELDDPRDCDAEDIGAMLTDHLRPSWLTSSNRVLVQLGLRGVVALPRVDRSHAAEDLVDEALGDVGAQDAGRASTLLRVRSMLSMRRGDLERARIERQHASRRSSHPGLGCVSLDACWSATLLLLLGQAARAERILDAVTSAPLDREPFLVPETRGWLALARGRNDRALGHFQEAGRVADLRGVRNPAVTAWRCGLARAQAACGDLRSATASATAAAEAARAFGARAPLAFALATQAVTRPDDRLALLAEAVDCTDAALDPLVAITSRIELGHALRVNGVRDRALAVLREAGDLAHHLGSSVVQRAVRVELLASGARPSRLALRGVDALTPAQDRTARLAARGSTNAEIAAELFVTVKTVESHLAKAFRKLDVRSRSELAEVFGDQL